MKRNFWFYFCAAIFAIFPRMIFSAENEISIDFINDVKKISLDSGKSKVSDAVLDEMKNLGPNYLAEVKYEIPFKGNEDLTKFVSTLFCNMNLYLEIPYYSERNDTTVPLFSRAELKSFSQTGSEFFYDAIFCMTPFSDYNATLKMVVTDESFLFLHENLDKMNFSGLAAIQKRTMKAGIAVYREGDVWKIFALGGIRAVKPPFLKKRLETAFNNRIKDFCVFYISRLDEYCAR
jgi:hypothetical protein